MDHISVYRESLRAIGFKDEFDLLDVEGYPNGSIWSRWRAYLDGLGVSSGSVIDDYVEMMRRKVSGESFQDLEYNLLNYSTPLNNCIARYLIDGYDYFSGSTIPDHTGSNSRAPEQGYVVDGNANGYLAMSDTAGVQDFIFCLDFQLTDTAYFQWLASVQTRTATNIGGLKFDFVNGQGLRCQAYIGGAWETLALISYTTSEYIRWIVAKSGTEITAKAYNLWTGALLGSDTGTASSATITYDTSNPRTSINSSWTGVGGGSTSSRGRSKIKRFFYSSYDAGVASRLENVFYRPQDTDSDRYNMFWTSATNSHVNNVAPYGFVQTFNNLAIATDNNFVTSDLNLDGCHVAGTNECYYDATQTTAYPAGEKIRAINGKAMCYDSSGNWGTVDAIYSGKVAFDATLTAGTPDDLGFKSGQEITFPTCPEINTAFAQSALSNPISYSDTEDDPVFWDNDGTYTTNIRLYNKTGIATT